MFYHSSRFVLAIGLLVLLSGMVWAKAPGLDLESFDQGILDYYPEQREGVADEIQELWRERLEETYTRARAAGALNISNYWNLIAAFQSLKADPELIRLSFLRAAETDPDGWRTYLTEMPHKFDSQLPDEYSAFMAQAGSPGSAGDMARQEAGDALDQDLIALLDLIKERDQRHRGDKDFMKDPSAQANQRELDQANAALIDSLYSEHQQYLGSDHVGESHGSTMWAVVQHSGPERIARYLPCFVQANKDGQLTPTMLKMAIDRLHALQSGWQVFGSQEGVPMAKPETRARIKKQYGF